MYLETLAHTPNGISDSAELDPHATDMTHLESMAVDLRNMLTGHAAQVGTTIFQGQISRERFVTGPSPALVDSAIIYKPDALKRNEDQYVVGFSGHTRDDIPGDLGERMRAMDALIRSELVHTPILSYSSRRRPDGQWINLMVFPDAASVASVHSPNHGRAVAEIAPLYYDTIDLHHAIAPGGITSEKPLQRIRTDHHLLNICTQSTSILPGETGVSPVKLSS